MPATSDRLWRHFTTAGAAASPIVIDRGEGCYIWDTEGNRYLDALAALYCVNIGYGPWPEIAEAARAQLERLPFFTNWVGFATQPALDLADKLAELVPIDVGRVFFCSGGSEAVESALKVARQYHRLRGEPTRYKYITRRSAYHGTTMGAISINGSPALRAQFEPLLPGCLRAPMPYRYRCPYCSEASACTLQCADEIDEIIRNEDPLTVAAVILEPVQNSAGSIVPPEGYFDRVREICDEHGVLLVADEVICGFGRVGDWFGSTRYGIEPDMMTMAKGLTSAYAPLGALVASEKVIEPFFADPGSMFIHGITFGGHPVSCAIALANLEIMEREDLIGHVQRMTPEFRGAFDTLAEEHPMVGDVRGDGCFYSFELVKDKETKATFTPDRARRADQAVHGPARARARRLHARGRPRRDGGAVLPAARRRPRGAGRVHGRVPPGARRGVRALRRQPGRLTMTRTLQNFIGGDWADATGEDARTVVSPVTGETLAEAPNASAEDVRRATAAARAAQPAWAALSVFDRAEVMHRIGDLLEERKEELARSLTLENGKPYKAEALDDIHEMADNFRSSAEDAKRLEVVGDPDPGRGQAHVHGARPERRLRGDHAVELPRHDPGRAGRAGDRGRQHVRGQAVRVDADRDGGLHADDGRRGAARRGS